MKIKLIIILSTFFLFSCKEFEEIKITGVDGFFLNKITSENIEAEIKLKINNPNNLNFSIYPSEFDIIFSGIRIGKAKLNKRVHIKAKSERVYSFYLNSKISELNPLDVLRLVNLENLGKIEVKGELNAGKLYVKKQFPVNFTEKVKIFR